MMRMLLFIIVTSGIISLMLLIYFYTNYDTKKQLENVREMYTNTNNIVYIKNKIIDGRK